MYNFDHDLFLWLNFDGGPRLDRVMSLVSGLWMWISLYVLILLIMWGRGSRRQFFIFAVIMILTLVLSDMVAGIFKQTGMLAEVLPELSPRPRPMFEPTLEGLDPSLISADSMRVLRRAEAAREWVVHVPKGAIGGLYGTVSGHAATICSLAVLSCGVIRRRWFSILMAVIVAATCYSRIYLAKHYPMDIVWGALWGLALGFIALWTFRRLVIKR